MSLFKTNPNFWRNSYNFPAVREWRIIKENFSKDPPLILSDLFLIRLPRFIKDQRVKKSVIDTVRF
ncbi:hypothetical protein MF1_06830 [Bartonella quintana]|uniref:hypothetical protein n=1 Tax=Bartonella quintana TaxID=803 RepID=UPI0013163A2D|nr:hypothetical protein [Bartonella quintana]BBL53425.1 hypothetical protein MF1_06830 [Bartonella quintana]